MDMSAFIDMCGKNADLMIPYLHVTLYIIHQPCLENVQIYFDIQHLYQNKNIYVHRQPKMYSLHK